VDRYEWQSHELLSSCPFGRRRCRKRYVSSCHLSIFITSSHSHIAASSALGGLVDGAATASAPQNFTNTVSLPPVNVDKASLFSNSISYGDAKLVLGLDAKAQIKALATITVDANGTLVPPVMDSFSIVGKMNGTSSGDITLCGDLTVRCSTSSSHFSPVYSIQGSLDTGKIPIFQADIPGFDFPGILHDRAFLCRQRSTLSVSADAKVELNYNLNGIRLVFPPGSAGDEQWCACCACRYT
jgi:hypothetical protein